jgi:sugar phosphate permease
MNQPMPATLRVFIPFALGYFLSYLYRVVNVVIAPDLVSDLSIGSLALGLLRSLLWIAVAMVVAFISLDSGPLEPLSGSGR